MNPLSRPATVYVVDDDPSIRKSLDRLLTQAGYETKSFGCAQDFLSHYGSHSSRPQAECLILDFGLPDLNGVQLQQNLASNNSQLPIVFITGHIEVTMSIKAMKEGAIDFLLKPFDDSDLLSAVQKAIEKQAEWKKEKTELTQAKKYVSKLTPREFEVFRWVIAGTPNKQIARRLGTSEKTIKAHRGKVMLKMAVNSVADLVRRSLKARILPADRERSPN